SRAIRDLPLRVLHLIKVLRLKVLTITGTAIRSIIADNDVLARTFSFQKQHILDKTQRMI
ncbi:MAG: hypothetical protein WC404_06790, partial [Candidatus Omnitrophota bacterium]